MRIVQWSKVDARWYLGVLCRKCEAPILIALDHSEGEAQPARAEKLLQPCSRAECGHKADYTTAKVSRFEKSSPAQTEETSFRLSRTRREYANNYARRSRKVCHC